MSEKKFKDTLAMDLWFPTIVWNDNLKHIDNKMLNNYVLNLKEKDKGRIVTNYGGWQSNMIKSKIHEDLSPSENTDIIEKFIESLQNAINQCVKMAGLMDLQICDYWWNINYKGDYNKPHHHRDSILSGVYYIDIPEDNMGDIHFEREDPAQYFLPRYMPTRNKLTSTRATYKPKTGGLLIFPSWVTHSVDGNKTDKPRISMSFNTTIARTPANDELARMNGAYGL
jgi:uncharacterized protein (TIGR02466 family)